MNGLHSAVSSTFRAWIELTSSVFFRKSFPLPLHTRGGRQPTIHSLSQLLHTLHIPQYYYGGTSRSVTKQSACRRGSNPLSGLPRYRSPVRRRDRGVAFLLPMKQLSFRLGRSAFKLESCGISQGVLQLGRFTLAICYSSLSSTPVVRASRTGNRTGWSSTRQPRRIELESNKFLVVRVVNSHRL